ncbi:MAG: PAS domain S-box protein [Desulfomonile tiedjei]|uniref:histidine kinase n=1 Tax=Desulfomonile tiedjei TaxID=2358 RepID=A0A9D6V3H0_9BACT|nr:PAS domain S-box protein [Desulfomonile tiedjei]
MVAAVAAAMCGAYRLWLGGGGAWVGVSVIVESAGLGVAFYLLWRSTAQQIGAFSLWGFGLLVHVIMLAIFLALPGGAGPQVLRQMGLPILFFYPLATMIICQIFLDYERQLQDRKALQESEERYRAIFENAAVGIDVVNADGRFLQANESLASMLGYGNEELQNLTFLDISHPDDSAASRVKHEEMVKGRTDSYRFEKRYIRKDGDILWADFSVSPVVGPGGDHMATIAVIADITDRRKQRKLSRMLRPDIVA